MAKAGRGDDQYMVRFPVGLRDHIKTAAEANGRSMNSEIIDRLEKSFDPNSAVNELLSLVGEQQSEIASLKWNMDQRIESAVGKSGVSPAFSVNTSELEEALKEERRLREKYEKLWERTYEVSSGYREMFEHAKRYIGTYINLVQFLAGEIMTMPAAPSEDLVKMAGKIDRTAYDFKTGLDTDAAVPSLANDLREIEGLIEERRRSSEVEEEG